MLVVSSAWTPSQLPGTKEKPSPCCRLGARNLTNTRLDSTREQSEHTTNEEQRTSPLRNLCACRYSPSRASIVAADSCVIAIPQTALFPRGATEGRIRPRILSFVLPPSHTPVVEPTPPKMPFRPQHSLLKIDVAQMHTIDTRSVEDLFGMWSGKPKASALRATMCILTDHEVFSKTSEAMEDGKRLENLSWRLWNRETFCCCPETQARSKVSPQFSTFPPRASIPVPELATSAGTVSSLGSVDEASTPPNSLPTHGMRPELRRADSIDTRSRGREKHITPVDLEKIVISIQEKKSLEPLSPLPHSSNSLERPTIREPVAPSPQLDTAPVVEQKYDSDALQTSSLLENPLESSTSTVATSESHSSQRAVSSDSSSTETSAHRVVRGFTPGGAPSSYRSQTQLATQPTPILKTSMQHQPQRQPRAKGKGAMFTLGTPSDEGESSLDTYKNSLSSLARGFDKHASKKHASFKEEVSVRASAIQDSPVFEDSDDEDDEDVSESVIEEDEDSSEWEDEGDIGESGHSSEEERPLFQRVDSRPNLTSHRSLLTSLMHEPDRAKAMQNAASRSVPAFRRSRTTTPSGPSMSSSPLKEMQVQQQQLVQPRSGHDTSQPKPIIMTTSNTHQPSLSPRTTRRNMLSTELTESLRRNLLWERQHKSSQNIAALKRRHTAHDLKTLKQYPGPQPVLGSKNTNSGTYSNTYFDAGLQEYHAKGW